MAYYMLSRGGLAEKRFQRVEGYADRRLKEISSPLAAENRRIEILLRRGAAMSVAPRAWVWAAVAVAAPAAAFADLVNLAEMVDGLQRIQVQIAQGDKAAYALQLNQLKTMGAAIAAAPAEAWKDRRQADLLVIYILSGGPLVGVAPLLKGDIVVVFERALARGALAYVTNHEAEAEPLLDNEDLNSLDVRVAGEVAFVRSVLETKRDFKAAVELLDWARLLAPGGLVEEAALRREIALLAAGEGRRARSDVDPARFDLVRRLRSTRSTSFAIFPLQSRDWPRRRPRQLPASIARGCAVGGGGAPRLPPRAGKVRDRRGPIRRRRGCGVRGARRRWRGTARKPCAPASTLRPA